MIDGEELCDDGNMAEGDGCNPDCKPSGTEVARSQYPDMGKGSDGINALVQDAEGNLIAAGYIGVGEDQTKAWLAKLSPDGELLWEHEWASASGNYNYYYSVAVAADGKIAAGGMAGALSKVADSLVTVLDKSGKVIYTREILEETEIQQISEVVITESGQVIAVENATDDFVAHVRAFDAAGEDLWTHSTAKTWYNGAVARTPEGATMVAVREVVDNGGTHDLRVFVISDDNKVMWTKQHGDPLTRYAPNAMVIGPYGDVTVCGWLSRTKSQDALLMGLDQDGALRWKTRVPVPGPGYDYCSGVTRTRDGGVAFAGSGFTGDPVVDMWVGKLDGLGTPVWTEAYSSMGAWADYAHGIVELPSGELVIGGAMYDEAAGDRVRTLLRITP